MSNYLGFPFLHDESDVYLIGSPYYAGLNRKKIFHLVRLSVDNRIWFCLQIKRKYSMISSQAKMPGIELF